MKRARLSLLTLLLVASILLPSSSATACPLTLTDLINVAVWVNDPIPSEPIVVELPERVGYIKEYGHINVRETASTKAMVIDTVCFGQELMLYEQVDDFTHVKIYAEASEAKTEPEVILDGFIYSSFLSEEPPADPRICLDVPLYKQGDDRWRWTMIGGYETLDSAGCTTTCISMLESYLTGEAITPDIMVTRLTYDYDGYLTFPDGYERYSATNYLNTALEFLHQGYPVLISLYAPWGTPHWVLIKGYTGNGIDLVAEDFLVNDPGRDNYTLAGTMTRYSNVSKLVIKTWNY